MDIEKLAAGMDAASEMQSLAVGFHPEHQLASEAMQLRLVMALAVLYMADMAKALRSGADADEALIRVLEGKKPLPPDAIEAMESARAASLN